MAVQRATSDLSAVEVLYTDVLACEKVRGRGGRTCVTPAATRDGVSRDRGMEMFSWP
jgi:hypothetical protein